MNSINIVGRLIADPELRTTSTGKNLVNMTVAVSKRIKPTNGDPDADFFRVTAWGQTANYINDYLSKGRLVAVTGRMESRKYTDKDGNKRESWEIAAENVSGLDRPRDDAPKPAKAKATTQDESIEYDPFADE